MVSIEFLYDKGGIIILEYIVQMWSTHLPQSIQVSERHLFIETGGTSKRNIFFIMMTILLK